MINEIINTKFAYLYIIALPVFLAIDMVWLGFIAKNFYKEQIGFLMRPDVNWVAAIVFYLLFIVGLVLFVISPAVDKSSFVYAAILGAIFGLITYSTYDLTNLATVKNWPMAITIVDLIWGTTLSSLVSTITYLIYTKIF
jgi:uncharacterized membrane protein